ncbi:hypothetical protein CCYA_CCYA14G3752 [Cyanidiococcus yangmingshanensis]|nr:hypothetical protein CCYA_CCYA14G3752 [Cyanidiococcus yangmingshanensis]
MLIGVRGARSNGMCWVSTLSESLLTTRSSIRQYCFASWFWRRQGFRCGSNRVRAQVEDSANWASIRSPQNAKLKLVRQILRHGSAILNEALDSTSDDFSEYSQIESGARSGASSVSRRQQAEPSIQPVQFLVEGARLLHDAIDARWTPLFILCAADSVKELWRRQPELMRKLWEEPTLRERTFLCEAQLPNDTVHSQGLVAVFHRQWVPWNQQSDLVLFLDAIQDPGNLGTILRSACAAGTRAVFLSANCVDVWSAKVIRAGMGAHFRQCILDKQPLSDLVSVLALASTTNLVFGPEASPATHLEPGGNASDLSAKVVTTLVETERKRPRPPRYRFIIGHHRKVPDLPHFLYDDATVWNSAHSSLPSRNGSLEASSEPAISEYDPQTAMDVLVIGNEARGPSDALFDLARQYPGSCTVAIPLESGVESLNAAAAASVLLFEAQRHRRRRRHDAAHR